MKIELCKMGRKVEQQKILEFIMMDLKLEIILVI